MFEALRDHVKQAVETLQEKYDGFTDSVDKFNQDILEIRDLFISVKNIVFAIFSFIGQETAILLFCTMLFLFVINLIPFFFLDKKIRYYIGVGFGVFLSFFFGYTSWSLAKYVLIMFSPVIVEYLLVKLFKLIGTSLGSLIKKFFVFIKTLLQHLLKKLFEKNEKNNENEKQVLKK